MVSFVQLCAIIYWIAIDCPRCHEPGGIEAFVKDGILAEDGVCDNCGYILPEGTELEEVE